MFSTLRTDSDILDTFKIEATGIVYKQLHALRTYEAYQQMYKLITFGDILLKYDEIEKQLTVKGVKDKIVRVVFSARDFMYTFTVAEHVAIQSPVRLELIKNPVQKSGLGPQNYKWQQRLFWDKLIQNKTKDAFDVISVNEKDELVETSRFNIFLYDKITDLVLTSALSSGCINGVFRRLILHQGYIDLPNLGRKKIQETGLPADKIFDYQLFVANSVRGVLSAELI